jgi:subtilase family serine protease
MTTPSDTIRIIADYHQNIAEDDEQNNNWEAIWQVTENLPDLIVESLECGEGNKLSVTIKNIGKGTLPPSFNANILSLLTIKSRL